MRGSHAMHCTGWYGRRDAGGGLSSTIPPAMGQELGKPPSYLHSLLPHSVSLPVPSIALLSILPSPPPALLSLPTLYRGMTPTTSGGMCGGMGGWHVGEEHTTPHPHPNTPPPGVSRHAGAGLAADIVDMARLHCRQNARGTCSWHCCAPFTAYAGLLGDVVALPALATRGHGSRHGSAGVGGGRAPALSLLAQLSSAARW